MMKMVTSYFQATSHSPWHCMVIFCFMWISFHLHGQDSTEVPASDQSIRKGKTLIGSYFNFSLSTVNKNRANNLDTKSDVTRFGINVTGGKMLSDHWGLLLSVGYLKSAVSTPITFNGTLYSVEDNRLEYSIAPAVRYYSMINEATYFFLQGTVFLSRGTSDADELDNNNKIVQLNSKTSGFGVSISPGISYFLTKKLTTEIAIGVLGYSVVNSDDGKGNNTETKTFQSLLYLNSVSLGFVYYL